MKNLICALAAIVFAATVVTGQSAQTTKGIDVSHYQGAIEWPTVASQDVVFAIAKATQGASGKDQYFAANWPAMKAAGVIRGAYHFFVIDDDPVQQVANIMDHVTLEAGDLPIFVDVEAQSYTASKQQLTENLSALLQGIETATGMTPIIYTEASFWNDAVGADFSHYPLWAPHYGVSAPTMPTGWSNWTFWQFSQTGAVTGINGDVLLDAFNGDLASLKSMTKSR